MGGGIHMIPGAQKTAQQFQVSVCRVFIISGPAHAPIIE
jgi:hypothetical protein